MAERGVLLGERWACATCRHGPVPLVGTALCKGVWFWGQLMKEAVGWWSDPVHPAKERPLWRDKAKGENQLWPNGP